MSTQIDVQTQVARINKTILDHGFRKPGSESDFQFGDDTSLRFKTGTVYGEVTVTVWKHQKQIDVIRCTNDEQVTEALYQIDSLITSFFFEASSNWNKADC